MNKKCEKLNDITTKLKSNKLANEILIIKITALNLFFIIKYEYI